MSKRQKYNAVKTSIDGHKFDSKAEAKRYTELKLLERAGEISNLELQPKYRCEISGKLICTVIPDFRYTDLRKLGPQGQVGCVVVEDKKSPITRKNPVYRIKKKLLEALFPGVEIVEV